ncbi:MAG TPA: helix-turn-helix transcriptional regulator [Ktedonobacteraceae bacterium]|nr:helix-turn-helix transcriptional regulator [Ktedonobacteraceae bacterium]
MTEQQQKRVEIPYLRAWRMWRGLSIQELAKLAGVSVTTISRLENGVSQPNFSTLHRLARGLNLTREQLLHNRPNGQTNISSKTEQRNRQ